MGISLTTRIRCPGIAISCHNPISLAKEIQKLPKNSLADMPFHNIFQELIIITVGQGFSVQVQEVTLYQVLKLISLVSWSIKVGSKNVKIYSLLPNI